MFKLFQPKHIPASQPHLSNPQCASCNSLQHNETSHSPHISASFNWDLREFAAARRGTCEICVFVIATVDALVKHENITELHNVLVRAKSSLAKNQVADVNVWRKNETELTIHLSVGTFLIRGTEWHVYGQNGSTTLPWARLAPTPSKGFFGNTGSAAAAGWAKTQIEKCASKHDSCAGRVGKSLFRSTRERLLPKRVIELLGGGKLRLTTSNSSEVAVYACLSHCWGGKQTLTTTNANLVDHHESIDPEMLPRTFKDVITFLGHLKIRYIWIDSLCIIQDSKDDWFEESGKMAQVYANAFITIAATRAGNGDAGLFSDTNSVSAIIGTSEVLLCRQPIHASPGNVTNDEFPLLKRGWVAQELLLSPRLLQFCNGEMIFECMEGLVCSCGLSEQESSYSVKHKIWANSQEDPKRGRKITSSEKQALSHIEMPQFDEWRGFASQYSHLELTFQQDRFPAMSGLAHRFAAGLGSTYAQPFTYAAGLWVENMHNDLLWHVPHRLKPKARAEDTTAPTWSWVSCSTSVAWWGCNPGDKLMFGILEVRCDPVSDRDPFGMLSEAMLKLRAPIFEMRLRKSVKHYDVELEGRWGIECTPDLNLDTRIREDGSRFVGLPSVLQTGVLRGLVLWKRDSATYERVGLWFCDAADAYWKQTAPEEDWRAEQLGHRFESLMSSEVIIV